MIKYTQITNLSDEYIQNKIETYLEEDKVSSDITSLITVPPDAICNASIEAETECVFVGEKVIKFCLSQAVACSDMSSLEDNSCSSSKKRAGTTILTEAGYSPSLKIYKHDGDVVKEYEVIAEIQGNARHILGVERVLLNIIQRLSGIATATRKYVDIARPYNVAILDTRKTTPGMRLFEKYAVNIGGGRNHRLDLGAGMLIKDNHIKAAGGIKQAVEASLAGASHISMLPIELEVDNLEQLEEGLALGVKGFLLDNMQPEMICQAVSLIRNSKAGADVFIEASGGISLDNLRGYITTGVNAISIGALTHRVVSSDIHINFL